MNEEEKNQCECKIADHFGCSDHIRYEYILFFSVLNGCNAKHWSKYFKTECDFV